VTATDLQNEIVLTLSRGDTRLFRINAGSAWAGAIVRRTAAAITLSPYYPVRLGPTGYPDLSGWSAGAIYTAMEVKYGKDRVRTEQQSFIDLVLSAGGRAGVARSVEDARRIVTP
jgi:hypothetical protein